MQRLWPVAFLCLEWFQQWPFCIDILIFVWHKFTISPQMRPSCRPCQSGFCADPIKPLLVCDGLFVFCMQLFSEENLKKQSCSSLTTSRLTLTLNVFMCVNWETVYSNPISYPLWNFKLWNILPISLILSQSDKHKQALCPSTIMLECITSSQTPDEQMAVGGRDGAREVASKQTLLMYKAVSI